MPKKPNQPTPQERRRSRKAFRQAMTKELREHRELLPGVLRAAGADPCGPGAPADAGQLRERLLLRAGPGPALPAQLAPGEAAGGAPPPLEITILCFIFAAEILGEVNAFYVVVPNWDTMLHTLNGFLAAAVGLSMVILLNDNEKVVFDLSPFFLALLAFCFSMTIGVLWEFFEFFMDSFFGMDMQKDTVVHAIHSVTLDPTRTNQVVTISGITDTAVNGESLGLGGYLDIGIIDTMKDLFVNFLGALVFSVSGYFYARSRGKKKSPALNFVPTRKTPEQDYLQQAQEEEP